MTDVKALIDQYADEARRLRAMVELLQTALVLATAHSGKADGNGDLVLAIPAKARTRANNIDGIQTTFSNPDKYLTHGSLRIKAIKRKVTNDND